MKKTLRVFVLLLLILQVPVALAESTGADENNVGTSEVRMGSLVPITTETGKITLSVDALGVYTASTGTIQVEKPSSDATVRCAYLATATLGFQSSTTLSNGDVQIDGTGVTWTYTTPSSINSKNYWADVTSIVKTKLDAAPAGRVDFTITEMINSYYIDGSILAVVFDDPEQTVSNTVVLLFGAQDVDGDTFAISLADPLDLDDPNLILDFSLGISYSYQVGDSQYSQVDVNGIRMTTWAGGEDDGGSANGRLITAGGLDDSNANPADAYATPIGNYRYDDELYDLLPFVETGDTSINVYTLNPSDDDNVFFAALFLGSATAVVGEGIVLGPVAATNPVGTKHMVTAKVQDDLGNPIAEVEVTFSITSGPNMGTTGSTLTDANGEAKFEYTGNIPGKDIIVASFTNSQQETEYSNNAEKIWTPEVFMVPEVPLGTVMTLLTMLSALVLSKSKQTIF